MILDVCYLSISSHVEVTGLAGHCWGPLPACGGDISIPFEVTGIVFVDCGILGAENQYFFLDAE